MPYEIETKPCHSDLRGMRQRNGLLGSSPVYALSQRYRRLILAGQFSVATSPLDFVRSAPRGKPLTIDVNRPVRVEAIERAGLEPNVHSNESDPEVVKARDRDGSPVGATAESVTTDAGDA